MQGQQDRVPSASSDVRRFATNDDDREDDDPSQDDDEEDLMDDDGEIASSDSELQVEDPHQKKGEEQQQQEQIDQNDPMQQYLKKQQQIIQWLKLHTGEKWVDPEFPCSNSQFYEDPANIPEWGSALKNLQWKRPQQIIKEPKFMIVEQGKPIDIDAKHGVFASSWFIGALTIAGSKSHLIEKLIVQKDFFDRGFVSFQFFKNGQWVQVIVDTQLPYEKQQNIRNCLYSSCANPQQFWIQLMEKAYVKLHRNYQRICRGTIMDGIVDLTGGISQMIQIMEKQGEKLDNNIVWGTLQQFYQQKFLIGCMNSVEGRPIKNAQQGQQGILENHYYSIIDMRDFPKDSLKLIRIRNPWGNEGVWTGPFCQQADDWQKYKAVKQELKNVQKTKKADGSWWMSFTDFMMQFDKIFIGKVFPQNWENYSIEAQWAGKTNGGKCPINILGQKTHGDKQFKDFPEHVQMQSDDKWFNNPQFRIKVTKDTKIYISLMQEDQKISNQPYVPCSFMIASIKSRTQRIWERPPQADIIAEVNYSGVIQNQREIVHFLTLKKFEGKPFGIYMVIPNIVSDIAKKQQGRKFYLRMFSPQTIDVTQLTQTLQTTVDGQWNEESSGGSRKLEIIEQGSKKKGQIKDNAYWCRNPQYFLSLTQPTMLKIILRKAGYKKMKGYKLGMTICRFETPQVNAVQKKQKRQKNTGHNNLKRLIQQTNQYLEPPILNNIQRKLLVKNQEKFKQSCYFSDDVSALFFKWNPTEGPFIIIPSTDREEIYLGYKLTIFSNNPVNLVKLDDSCNQVVIGKWEKDISAGGCHLNQKQKEASQRTWSMNPKYSLIFKEEQNILQQPVTVKITLAVAERNWKNTVSGMIGLYFLQKWQGKLQYSEDIVISQTNFLPVKQIKMELTLGLQKPLSKNGYVIMPSTYESKVQGSFIISVKCSQAFELVPFK